MPVFILLLGKRCILYIGFSLLIVGKWPLEILLVIDYPESKDFPISHTSREFPSLLIGSILRKDPTWGHNKNPKFLLLHDSFSSGFFLLILCHPTNM